jgi:hypothetical protein
MKEDEPMDFVQPSAVSTWAFVGVVFWVLIMVVAGVRRVEPRWTGAIVVGLLIWMGLVSGASARIHPGDRSAMAFFLLSNAGALGLALSPVGRRLSALPMAALIGFQGFRLPLELILHSWVVGGTLPPQMTWTGRNWDVLSGALGLLLGLWGMRRPLPRAVGWGYSALGLGLLANVAWTALRSAPTPLRTMMEGPPVQLPYYLPYAWIVPCCVGGALAGHIVLLRRLLSPPQPVLTPDLPNSASSA